MTQAQVAALYRYPVKSMGGEQVDAFAVSPIGAAGDRNWAVVDTERRVIRNAKQWPELLRLRATYLAEPPLDAYDDAVAPVEIRSPDGSARRSTDPDVDTWLSEQLGRPVRLAARRPAHDRDHYRLPRARTAGEIASELDLLDDEVLPDYANSEDELVKLLQTSATPPGSYVDAYPLHLVSQPSLDTFRRRSGLDGSVLRFRPNVLLDVDLHEADGADGADDEQPELGWVGKRLQIGEVVLAIRAPTFRCSMPARAQPLLGVDADRAITRALVHHMQRQLGVNATVLRSGTIRAGDRVTVLAGDDVETTSEGAR